MRKLRFNDLVAGVEFCAFSEHDGWEIVCWPAGTMPSPTEYRRFGIIPYASRSNRRYIIGGHEYATLPEAIRALYDRAPMEPVQAEPAKPNWQKLGF
jgi:hypothetical protein